MELFRLTSNQEKFFRIILTLINNERKSLLLQLLDRDEYRTITDIRDELKCRYPSIEPDYLSKNAVLSIINDEFLCTLGIVQEGIVKGRRKVTAKAFKLRRGYETVKVYAGYTLEVMANIFNQSIYPILGAMNSPSDTRKPYEITRLLYAVVYGPKSVDYLIKNASYKSMNLVSILEGLSRLKDGNGNDMPLVITKYLKLQSGHKGYKWIRGSQATTRHPTTRWKELVKTLSSNADKVWAEKELQEKVGYNRVNGLNTILERLARKRCIETGFTYDWATVTITPIGRCLVYNLFEPIRGAIIGDELSRKVVEEKQPSDSSITKVLGYYINLKNQERLKVDNV